jgi:putative two-component system response regulator
VFDALASERSYKRAWPLTKVIEEIKRCREVHFDPYIVDSFSRAIPKITMMHTEFAEMT